MNEVIKYSSMAVDRELSLKVKDIWSVCYFCTCIAAMHLSVTSNPLLICERCVLLDRIKYLLIFMCICLHEFYQLPVN